ncbi:MAG: helix-turn-helix transcriptional regulator [Chthoniobacter sp.]|uniref:helix-turn-helix domain-containing protein n=1 Tax=Chthoniobacter sp. TaxID=2510640 RepID=UPI0032A1D7EB
MKHVRNLIGPQVRKMRFVRGLTQDELAARLQRAGWDVSRVSVAKIEAQLRWVTDCELYMLAHALQTPLEEFFPSAKQVKQFVGSPGFKRN